MDNKTKKRILITGGLGHIGAKLLHSIKPCEFEKIKILDNLTTQRYATLFNLPRDVNYDFLEDDILKVDMVKLMDDVDVVLHLDAITDAEMSFYRSDDVEKVNYHGTKRVAEGCLQSNTQLIFPSTTSVYGSQSVKVDENCPVADLKPQSPYAEYKLKSENMLNEMGENQGLKCIICRFGTIFGTSIGMRFHTAVNKFCWQAVMNKPLTVWKTAMNQKRPYLGLNDAISSIKFIIANEIFDNRVYNIVSSNNKLNEIVDHIKVHCPNLDIKYVESKIMNQLSYEVSSGRIIEQGFNFNDSLSVGIKETINLLKS